MGFQKAQGSGKELLLQQQQLQKQPLNSEYKEGEVQGAGDDYQLETHNLENSGSLASAA